MKRKTSKNDGRRAAETAPKSRRLRARQLLFVAVAAILLPLLFSASGMFQMKVTALSIPSDYSTGYEDRLNNLQPGDGIEAVDSAGKVYRIKYGAEENGFVTLARISQTNSLAGYTFRYEVGGSVSLGVNYVDGTPVSDGSFFGIGSSAFPFMGSIVIGGANDTVVTIPDGGWRYLFNNISNEASITVSADTPGIRMYSSYVYHAESSSDEARNSFVFAKTLTVTADGEMDISGFRFGAAEGSGFEGAVAFGEGRMALFAGEVKTGGGSTFSVDLSKCLTGGRYVVQSSAGDAGGIFGAVEAGVNATVTLPSSFRCEATSTSADKSNAGILVASNFGSVTFKTATADGTFTFLGSAVADGSSGLIGANQEGSFADFPNSFSLTIRAVGLRAGGIAGTSKGALHVKSAEITDSSFEKTTDPTVGRLGGAIASVDAYSDGLTVADGERVVLRDNTFTATNDCYIGGYVGTLTTAGTDIDAVTVGNLTVNGTATSSTRIGGYIGSLVTKQNASAPTTVRVTVDSPDSQFTMNGVSAGICGGVIGDVNAGLYDKVEILGEISETLNLSVDNGSYSTVGGIVGRVTGYVRVDGIALSDRIVRYNASADVAGTVAAGAVLEIGSIHITESNDSTLVAKTGEGSVLRLNGSIVNASASVLGIVFEQNHSLIYRDVGCSYTAGVSKNNDIGNYGQVFRNDTLGVLCFDADTHRVSVISPLDAGGSEILLRDAGDFMRLAVTFYTSGSISGVTGADCAALYGKNIRIGGNVSLAGTGIEQLTPANESTAYTGSIFGDGYTVTLSVGENINGEFPGVYTYKIGSTSLGNARKYIGLFSVMNGATVSGLTVNGNISTDLLVSGELDVGYLAGRVSGGEVTLADCTFGGDGGTITVRGVERTARYVGGAFGYIVNATGLSATGCGFLPSINDTTSTAEVNDFYYGGLAGRVTYKGSSSIVLTDNTIGTSVQKTAVSSEHKVGGLVGTLECNGYTQVDLRRTDAEGLDIRVAGNAGGSAGGILGHTFRNCRVAINGSFAGSVDAGSADLGGLIYLPDGRLDVEDGTSVDGMTLVSTGTLRGVLVADGKKAIVTVAAKPADFDGVTADGFDLFVGENIKSYSTVDVAASGGIVTVETGDGIGKLPDTSDWYALIAARPNTKTRYYFNIAGITPTSGTVASAADLIYWQLYDYAGDVNNGARQELLPTQVNNITASTDIDVTGCCFYPAAKGSVVVDFGGHRLTFGRPAQVACAEQFYGLSAGLLSDLSATGANQTVVLRNIVPDGTVSYLGGDKGSGALVCGTVFGSQPDANRYTLNLTVEGITPDGVKIEGSAAYRPLLINNFDSFVHAEISHIREGASVQASAASSLFGKGGVVKSSLPSSYVTIIFTDIKLDGSTASSEFTKATLFYDVSYVSGTGSIIYNFNFAEDWGDGNPHNVTYGTELTLDVEQMTYFDNEFFVHPSVKPTADSTQFDFTVGYLPYVYLHVADAVTNRGLSVNRKSTNLTDGWGTYENPYIITTAKQLDDLCNWLSGSTVTFSDGWSIRFPVGTWSSLSGLDLTDSCTVTASGNVLTSAETGNTLGTDILLQYLSGAYYKFADGRTLKLSSEYSGIGSASYPFHGVIHGNGGSVTLPDQTATENGYGFIKVANGCAVYQLTVRYSAVSASAGDLPTSGAATTGPNNTGTITTQIPHFGGVIARIVGGDNLIREVTVTYQTIEDSASHAAIGGYVGLISGGGVLFDGITPINGIYHEANAMKYLYRNNYVGRVLEGYAVAIDGVTYDNTAGQARGDFLIPRINLGTSATQAYSAGVFSVRNAEELLLLSFAINSGALSGNNGDAYGKTAVSRSGDYSHVGETYAGVGADGRYSDDTKKVSVLAEYFGIASPTDLRSVSLTIRLTGDVYDMTVYGNAFRAIGGAYEKSTVYKIASFGSESGATLKLDMDMLQYAKKKSSSSDFCDDEIDRIISYGVLGRVSGATELKNITLEGKVSLRRVLSDGTVVLTGGFTDDGGSNARTVGGLIGSTGGNVTLQNLATTPSGLTIVSPDIAGGFVGYHDSGSFTLENGAGCEVRQLKVYGKRNSGGAVGYVRSGNVTVDGLHIYDSLIETRTRTKDSDTSTSLSLGVGGVIGLVGATSGSTYTVNISNTSTQKTSVVFYANYKTGGERGTGGLIGMVRAGVRKVTFTSCTVDGGVVFMVANYSGSNYLYQTAASANTGIFPAEFLSALPYNGSEQESAKVLAYLLTQTSSGSNYASGAAGGFVGVGRANFAFTDCTVTATSSPLVVAGLDNAAGFIGEHRAGDTLEVTNSAITTGGYDLYVLGDTRVGGIVAYRDPKTTVATYTVDGFRVVGSPEHPVRFISYMYASAGEAAGLFGDISKINLTASNVLVSGCIMSGTRAAGVYATSSTGGSTITLTNVHVENNLIHSIRQYDAGGIFSNSTNANITLNGVYIADNRIITSRYAGGITGYMTAGTLYGKYLIMDRNVLQYMSSSDKKVTNHTFATKPLADDAALGALLKNPSSVSLTNVGQFVGDNGATVTLIAISYSDADGIHTAKRVAKSESSGSLTAVYAAHGAANAYVTAGGFGAIVDGVTAQERAIQSVADTAEIGGGLTPVIGDSAVDGNPDAIDTLWTDYGKTGGYGAGGTGGTFSPSAHEPLGAELAGISKNAGLQMLHLSGYTDKTMKEYLNMLTGNGFSDAAAKKLVTVTSQRYSVDENGGLTPLEKDGQPVSGSVVYLDQSGSFAAVGVYDNLEGETKTMTILTVTFAGVNETDVYTMHIALYYHRSVNLKTYVVPLEGEQYYLPSFNVSEPIGNTFKSSVTFGSPFTLYVEYNYNDKAMALEQLSNFYKAIELTDPNGFGDETRKIESGTSFALIDLNSRAPSGYSYYVMTLTEDAHFITFNDFLDGETGFAHVDLSVIGSIGEKIPDRVCSDDGSADRDCVYTERYLLVVFPVQKVTDTAMAYNLKAVIDEEQRKESNITVIRKREVLAEVSVWGAPTMTNTSEYVEDYYEFSNLPEEPLYMKVTSTSAFPSEYIGALSGQKDAAVYETHILQLFGKSGSLVTLPSGTQITVTSGDGSEEYYRSTLISDASQVRFSVGNILDAELKATNQHTTEYVIRLDFSGVSAKDFSESFATGETSYTLKDDMYLSGSPDITAIGPEETAKEYTAKVSASATLAVVPEDNRYLGINLSDPTDETNSGRIAFSVNALFDLYAGKTYESATISFSVEKKVYADGKYSYVPLTEAERGIWTIYLGNTSIVTDTLTVNQTETDQEAHGEYLLVVDTEDPTLLLTNYRVKVDLVATATDGTVVNAQEYFVFLVCRLVTEPD